MDFPIHINAFRMGFCPLYILKGHMSKLSNYRIVKSLKSVVSLAKSEESDEMQLGAAFNLGLYCMQNTPLRVSRI